jgi:hypothetical protein
MVDCYIYEAVGYDFGLEWCRIHYAGARVWLVKKNGKRVLVYG